MSENDRTELKRTDIALSALWANWALAYGAITLPLVLAIFVPRIWIPFICLAGAYIVRVMIRRNLTSHVSACSLVVNLAHRVLLLSALVMFFVVIIYTDWLVPTVIHLELYNTELPFVTCLVIFPILAIVAAITLYTGLNNRICRECQRRHGFYAGDSVVATLYYRDSKYQAMVLLVLALTLGAIEYWYYFSRYINASLNSPDLFFFNYMPLGVYVLSLFFMWQRYKSMQAIYSAIEERQPGAKGSTVLRYLIFCDDDLLLKQDKNGICDTPAIAVTGRTHTVRPKEAADILDNIEGITDAHIKYLYSNEGFARGSNMIHFSAFIPESRKESLLKPDYQWFTPYMLDVSLAAGVIQHHLANELYRIHTMTMAWKTYDRNGHRLYAIKHYRPTFRFRDMKDWDIDYNDSTWFDIAANNEDGHFFRTKQFLSKITDIFRSRKS